MRPTRRELLLGAGGAAAALSLPRRARAAGAGERRFIFVQALGGWDITQVFATGIGDAGIVHQNGCSVATQGDLSWVEHPARPNVSSFFRTWGEQAALVHGVNIASIAHPSALRLTLTSSLDAAQADWATHIGAASQADPVLPHLVVGGAYYAGKHGVHVGRGGSAGQLQGLAAGDLLRKSDQAVSAPPSARSDAVDAWLAAAGQRVTARARGAESERIGLAWEQAHERATRMKTMSEVLDFGGTGSLEDQAEIAVRAFEEGVSRCVTLSHPIRDATMSYDSHAVNDEFQGPLFEGLFSSLGRLLARLQTATSPSGGSLADETVVVVLSEMARSPMYNGSNGRDHWPCNSVLLLGSGVAGGRSYGGYDAQMYARTMDLASGEAADGGVWLGPEHIGATLLALADIDPADAGLTVGPIAGVLA